MRNVAHPRWRLTLAALLLSTTCANAQTPREILRQAETDFIAGRVEASVTGFDRVAELVPEAAPQLWQRGIALYYVGRYDDCRQMFESHRLVNPNDVENAAWHFMCVARADSSEAALEALLPVGPDGRRPMTQVYEMFAGRLSPDEVMAAAGEQPRAQFYAHLYIGLYHEAMGRDDEARPAILASAEDRFASAGGYMHAVAVVHRNQLSQ